jgi:hypothetical protein|tara:strand:- start:168 stop:830 length:663 start_codon:yes stop_codon:yes gene_type:complete
VYKKSIAKNHLSKSASEGRYGDDILVHMNKDEANVLAKAAGLESLPINPKTGLYEAWIFAAAGLALGAYAAWKGGSSATGQAGDQAALTGQQLEEVSKAKENLLPTKEAQTEVALLQYEQEGAKVGIGKEEAKKSLDAAMNRSGLVSSSGLEEKKASTWKQFAVQETGLNNKLGETMASIEEGYESEKLKLESEEKRLKLQKGQFEKQSQSWYLGKNLFG